MDNNVVNNGTSESISKTSIKNFAVYSRNKLIKDESFVVVFFINRKRRRIG